ncbi:cell division protein SepF [Natronolimnohabitans sp. A-GB9]|uniref:cell division protein SepF n=1 Tax=Natronolimnohabitans sp. A-GB9 TaxID=3069757 RepID=UPI0027B82214|nr:cell division protein SepF [Natronolimnohabitans sp. A-GB9]MDQ2050650.1 cell division protein SepF [Natronolimnohabitans sp. A-GB9]
MGLMSKILGGGGSRTAEDYVELDLDDVSASSADAAAMQVHIAEVSNQADAIDIKDAVYDGDIVIADITRLRTNDSTVEHIVDELRQVAHEVDGDIVRKGDDQMIITPTGVRISREKLGQRA